MLGTKIYTVHVNPEVSHAYEKPVFVREGFQLFAFLFMALWALYHRLWLLAAGLVAFEVVMMELGKAAVLSPVSFQIVHLAVQVLVGFHANDFLRARLKRQGYVVADIASGDTLLRAEQRFFERHLSTP